MGFFPVLSLYDSSLLVHRKATGFCILIIYPATLVNSWISSNRVLVETLGFSIYSIMSSVNITVYIFHPILILFIFFCMIAVARTSNTMLNGSGESGHLCLGSDFRGIVFRFSPLSMMLVAV